MKGHLTDIFSFRTAAVRNSGLGYMLCARDSLPPDHEHTAVFIWIDGEWQGESLPWSALSAAIAQVPKQQLVAMGASGKILVIGQGEIVEEDILEGQPRSEKDGSSLREVREVEGKVYAVGMDRQAYRRDGAGLWKRIDEGLPPGGKEVVGLESLHGFTSRDLYAVGWDGEIWRYDGQRWRGVSSPTNLLLNRVLCAGDGWVYACGQAGILLRGKGDQWTVIEQEDISEDIWDLEWFAGKLYLSTSQFLYTLGATGHPELVDFGEDVPETCYHLSAAAGVLWSIGAKDIMAFDGEEWKRID